MKKYDSVTTFDEIHNIFVFKLFLVYQLTEYRQGFLFKAYLHWKTPHRKQNFAP